MTYTVRISNRLMAGDSKTDTGFLHQLQKPSSNGWKRKDRYNFGNWEAYFTLTLRDKVRLRDCFANWLGAHVEERVGGRVRWAGMIYRMTYTHKGVVREISLENMYNAVCIRTEPSTYGGVGTYSDWAKHVRSIARYGRKEKILDARNQPAIGTKGTLVANFLAQHALPSIRVVGKESAGSNLENALASVLKRFAPSVKLVKPKTGENEMLGIECIGYAQTLGWVHDDSITSADNASDAIKMLTGVQPNYTGTAPRIATNTTQVRFTAEKRPVLHLIQEIVSIGSGTEHKYRFKMDTDRNTIYKPAETEPTLYLRGEKFYDSAFAGEAISPRLITPGLVRDMEWPFKAVKFSSSEVTPTDVLNLTNADFYIDEFEIAPDDSFAWTVATDDQNAAATWNYGY